MLPKILDIAEEHGLIFNPRTFSKKEVLCKCPFCGEDSKPGKEKKYYLSLNTHDQVYRCWYCGEHGGVLQFEAKLTGQTYQEVKDKRLGKLRKKIHAAERLNPDQLERAGWKDVKQKDKTAFKKNRDQVLLDWREYEYTELVGLYAELTVISLLDDANRQDDLRQNLMNHCEKSRIPDCYNRLLTEHKKAKDSDRVDWAKEGTRLARMAWMACRLQEDKEFKNIVLYIPYFHFMWKAERKQKKTILSNRMKAVQ